MQFLPKYSSTIIGNTLEPRQITLPLLCVSDLHIKSSQDPVFDQLISLVARIKPATLIFLGDVFDGWIGWDIDPALTKKWHTWITSLSMCLFFLPGNRDRLLTQMHLGEKILLLPDPSLFLINQSRWLLTHGDKYCTNDKLHQWFIAIHTPQLKRIFLGLPLYIRGKIKNLITSASRVHKKNLKIAYQHIALEDLKKLHRQYDADMILYGHTHMPRYLNKQGIQAITLGDWGAHPSYLYVPINKPWVLNFT